MRPIEHHFQNVHLTKLKPGNQSTIFHYLVEKCSELIVYYNLIKAVPKARSNFKRITGLSANQPKINVWTTTLCQNLIYSYFELILDLIRGVDKVQSRVEFDHEGLQQIQEKIACGKSVVLAGIHTCGFDHAIFGLNPIMPGIQILTKSDPAGGNLLMYQLRKVHKIRATPISVSALREAVDRLSTGGVAVAIDLPVRNGTCYEFFGQNCFLTSAHTRMAVKSNSALFLVYTRRTRSGSFRVSFKEIQPPNCCQNRKELISKWAQKSYRQLETFILRWPEAWYGVTFDLFQQS
jgi:lauroyl/myristoyl acyltransferase